MANRFKHEQKIDTPEALTIVPSNVEQAPVEEPKQEPEKSQTTQDLLESLKPTPKQTAKSYGFYLDDEVVAALDKLAKQNKSNRSKMLNTLLRKILL